MIDVSGLPRFGVGVARLLSLDRLLELAVEESQQDAGTANGLQRVPGHHHFRGCIGPELQVKPGDRRAWQGIGRPPLIARGHGVSRAHKAGPNDIRRQHGGTANAGCSEQPAATEREGRFVVLCGHGSG
jgi:hypothetical protein